MHHLVANNLSNATDTTSVDSWIATSDLIALFAVLLSAATWLHSRSIENKLRADSDERSKFDITFGSPLTARLEILETVISDFGHAIRSNSTMVSVATSMSEIQKHEHTDWYFGIDSILQNQNSVAPLNLNTQLNEYWDRSVLLIDQISNAPNTEQATNYLRELQTLADGFVGSCREGLVDYRQSISTAKPSFIRKCLSRLAFWK